MNRIATVLLLLGTLLVGDAFAQYGYHFGRNKVQYDQFEWSVLKTEHFDIYYYPEMSDLAHQGAGFAEEAYDELRNRFGFALNHRVPIIFYSSNLHFKQTNVTSGFIPDGVGGFFEFLKGRVVIPANGNIHRFRRVIRHELVHVFTYNKVIRVMRDHRRAPDRFLPLWFTEGLAEYWSGPQDHQHEMVMRDAMMSNYVVPMQNMYRIYGSFLMYKQGEAICRFISETYGEEKILDLLENVWMDRDFRVVIEETVREPFDDVSERWMQWMRERYFPSFEETEIPSLAAGGVSTQGFSAKPTFYQFADGTRKVFYVGNRSGYSNVFEVTVDSLYRPTERPRVLLRGERNDLFEALHLFESRLSVSHSGRLAFVTKSGGQDVIHLYDLEARSMESTLRFDRLVAVYSPSWSPEGDQLAFASIDHSGYSDIYTYSLKDDALQQITNDAYDDQDPSWSPDGARLAFASDRTSEGRNGAYNIFVHELESGQTEYVTFGDRVDLGPSWSPDGSSILFTSAIRNGDNRFTGRDLWVADMRIPKDDLDSKPVVSRPVSRLTTWSGAGFDPVWTDDGEVVFTAFEGLSFTIRHLDDLADRIADPVATEEIDLTQAGEPWSFKMPKIGVTERAPYRKQFRLDLAQALVSQNPVLGTTGGAVIAFSDMLGDDYLYLTVFNTAESQSDFLRSLSFSLARYQLHRRTNIGYGLFRFSGLRYDVTDPDAAVTYPRFFETVYGGFGLISYPISKFRRVEFETSLNWSRKDIGFLDVQREALLLSNSFSLVHDNALYWFDGPIQGWRGKLTAAYTTDIRYSNVSYYTLIADVRYYLRVNRFLTVASWGMARMNHGREARLFVMGGSWDLRGFRLFSVRGQKLWFTSHELRFPILENPAILFPILAPFGIASLRGSLFFDAAHAWNEDYSDRRPEILSGETLGAAGFGLRLNLFGSFVLRWDFGRRYRNGFREMDKKFKQFFFGWNF